MTAYPSVTAWDGAWSPVAAKFASALDHLHDTAAAIESYFRSDPLRFVDEPSAVDARLMRLFLIVRFWPEDRIAVRVGNLLHDLRSALNIGLRVAWPEAGRNVDFPIRSKLAAFDEWTRFASPPEAIREMLWHAQPFSHTPEGMARDSDLAILARLNNIDKHKGLTLLPIGRGRSSSAVLSANAHALVRSVEVEFDGGPLTRRTLMYTVSLHAPSPRPVFTLQMDQVGMAIEDYWPAVAVLRSMMESVETALHELRHSVR